MAIAPDGTWLPAPPPARRRAADLGHEQHPTTALTGHHGAVTAVAIAPDGTWLATTGGNDRTVRIWAADGTPRTTLTGHHGAVTAVAIAPDGTWLATATTTARYGSGPSAGRPARRYSDRGRR